MRPMDDDAQGFYTIAVLVTIEAQLLRVVCDLDAGPNEYPIPGTFAELKTLADCVTNAIRQLCGPNDLRDRFAEGVRGLFDKKHREFDLVLQEVMDRHSGYPSRWLLWALAQELRLAAESRPRPNAFISLN